MKLEGWREQGGEKGSLPQKRSTKSKLKTCSEGKEGIASDSPVERSHLYELLSSFLLEQAAQSIFEVKPHFFNLSLSLRTPRFPFLCPTEINPHLRERRLREAGTRES